MKNRLAYLTLLVILGTLLPVAIPSGTAMAMTGSGIPGDPYMVYNATDLQDMDLALGAWYELANDIDASNTSSWNGGAGFDPVGTSGTPFTGHFNGNGYTISDLTINRPTEDYIGLFGYVDGSSGDHVTIDNVVLTGINYTGDDSIGGLVGVAFTYTDISYCEVDGIITGAGSTPGWIGGLIGLIDASYTWESTEISRCRVIVDIDAGGHGADIGGFIGRAFKGTIIDECSAYGEVRGHNNVGGFVGNLPYGTISDCFAWGDVYMTDNGGIGAAQDGGGFLGVCGGFGGKPYRCYSIGTVYCQDAHGCTNQGCFAGQVTTSCTACFWDKQVTSCTSSACGTGKFTSEMHTESTFTNAGWNFTTIWGMDPGINANYAYHLWTWNISQVVWFQPNAIIQGTTLPNRATGSYPDGEIHWGTNPLNITITHGIFTPDSDYEFSPITPTTVDIIKPVPPPLVEDVDTVGLRDRPLYPVVEVVSSIVGLGGTQAQRERLAWLGLAWLIVIAGMLLTHLGGGRKVGWKQRGTGDTEPQHFILTTVVGLGLTIWFYSTGVFPWAAIILMSMGLLGAVLWERQPVA